MKGDDKVIDYLNRAIRSELTAVSQYWLHSGCKRIGASATWRGKAGPRALRKCTTPTSSSRG